MANNIFNYIQTYGESSLSLSNQQLTSVFGDKPNDSNIIIYPDGLKGDNIGNARANIPFVIFAPYIRKNRNLSSTGTMSDLVSDTYPPPSFAIALPLPTSGLISQYGVEYSATGLGAVPALALNQNMPDVTTFLKERFNWKNLAAGAAAGGFAALIAKATGKDVVSETAKAFAVADLLGSDAVQASVVNEGLALLDESTRGAVSAKFGVSQNPFTEQVFKNVQPRTFSYKFKFYPKNIKEAETIDRMIQVFKFYMLPAHATGLFSINSEVGTFFTYPYEFYITYSVQDTTFTLLPSVLTKMEVRYNEGMDSPKFYVADVNGKQYPYQTSLSLDFTEVMILTRDKIAAEQNIINKDYENRNVENKYKNKIRFKF